MATDIFRLRRSMPEARQAVQGVFMTFPEPRQAGQELTWANWPKILLWDRRTCPLPRQVVQELISEPGSLPSPEQCLSLIHI